MKIYKVAHENIIYPKEYRIIEIMKGMSKAMTEEQLAVECG